MAGLLEMLMNRYGGIKRTINHSELRDAKWIPTPPLHSAAPQPLPLLLSIITSVRAEGAKWKARWLLSENYGCWTSGSFGGGAAWRRRGSQRLSGNVKGLGWVQRTDKGSLSLSSFPRLLITNESFYIPLFRGGLIESELLMQREMETSIKTDF